jgi:hypothetical protein
MILFSRGTQASGNKVPIYRDENIFHLNDNLNRQGLSFLSSAHPRYKRMAANVSTAKIRRDSSHGFTGLAWYSPISTSHKGTGQTPRPNWVGLQVHIAAISCGAKLLSCFKNDQLLQLEFRLLTHPIAPLLWTPDEGRRRNLHFGGMLER